MFSMFFKKKNESSPEEEPIPSGASNFGPGQDSDFEHVAAPAEPAIPDYPGLYPQFNRLGINTQQSVDKGPQQSLMGVPFKLAAIVLSKNNASVDAQKFQVHEIMCRMRRNLDSPHVMNYEFNAERSVLQC